MTQLTATEALYLKAEPPLRPAISQDGVTVYGVDCLRALRELPDGSVDSIVTDPPYGLEFMGKDWDAPWKQHANAWATRDKSEDLSGKSSSPFLAAAVNKYQAGAPFQEWCRTWAAECLRILKPGGHLLAFGGTRTWHRLACAIEDAGFEIRDNIAWLYGSGFPKSLDVSKAIDKAAGVAPASPNTGMWNAGSQGAGVGHQDGWGAVTPHRFDAVSEDAKAWQGWGTALKPAHEPIVVARKPFAGTVAANVLQHGTGGLNIDGCRVGRAEGGVSHGGYGNGGIGISTTGDSQGQGKGADWVASTSGRWPANVVLDEHTAPLVDAQSGQAGAAAPVRSGHSGKSQGIYGDYEQRDDDGATFYGDKGGASRFFYCAKAPTSERPKVDGTAHPTVKPLTLMRWLCRLVTPPGGVVLEPFAGSGTTIEAALLEGFEVIGCEMTPEYLPLIQHRIDRAKQTAASAPKAVPTLFDNHDG